MKAKLTTCMLVLSMAVLAVLVLGGCSGPWAGLTPLDLANQGWGDTPPPARTPTNTTTTARTRTNTTTMFLGSDEYAIGAMCAVSDPLSSLAPRTIEIVTLDGEFVNTVFQVMGQWLYTDPTRRQAWEESCGWCEGYDGNGSETTAMNGVMTLAPHSIDPANPTEKPLKVYAVLRGILQ